MTYSTEYHATVADSAANYAKKLGLKVRTFDSELKVDKQISAIESFVANGASAIIIGLFDPPGVRAEILKLAHRVMVMRAGRVAAVLDTGQMSQESILGAALGVDEDKDMRRSPS